jgi:hypothetical protein
MFGYSSVMAIRIWILATSSWGSLAMIVQVTQAVPKRWFNSVVIERGVDRFDYLLIVHKKSERLIAGGSVTNALHIFEQNLLAAAVIKFGGPPVEALKGVRARNGQ